MPCSNIIKKRLQSPICSLDFAIDSTLFIGGGEGSGHSTNRSYLASYEIDERKKEVHSLCKHELLETDCIPTSIACHPKVFSMAVGINTSTKQIEAGNNKSCRLFDINIGSLEHYSSLSVSSSKQPQEYQKVTRFSVFGTYLATGFSDGTVSVFKTDDWTLCFAPLQFKDVQDIDFDASEDYVVVTTSSALILISIDSGTISRVIDSPQFNRNTDCKFQACRFGMSTRGAQALYATVNDTLGKRGFVCVWDHWKSALKLKPRVMAVCRKSISSFAISPLGDTLAYASNDLSIGLLNATTLKHTHKIKHVDKYPMTIIAFSPSGDYLACAGVDDCFRIIFLNQSISESPFSTLLFVVLDIAQIALLVHILVQYFG
ncbi:quinon protein alcohol dehydrogenase-like superfamily [Choanephora cucurbitarum]|nr:quinon protein alcohol dehydrogenase-like superfamily [Choanephora cucurbitarum]